MRCLFHNGLTNLRSAMMQCILCSSTNFEWSWCTFFCHSSRKTNILLYPLMPFSSTREKIKMYLIMFLIYAKNHSIYIMPNTLSFPLPFCKRTSLFSEGYSQIISFNGSFILVSGWLILRSILSTREQCYLKEIKV